MVGPGERRIHERRQRVERRERPSRGAAAHALEPARRSQSRHAELRVLRPERARAEAKQRGEQSEAAECAAHGAKVMRGMYVMRRRGRCNAAREE